MLGHAAVANERSATVAQRDGQTSSRLEVDDRRRPLATYQRLSTVLQRDTRVLCRAVLGWAQSLVLAEKLCGLGFLWVACLPVSQLTQHQALNQWSGSVLSSSTTTLLVDGALLPLCHSPVSVPRLLSHINENVLQLTNNLNCLCLLCADILEPRKPRPETTTFAARNMVHGALGLQRPSSKEHHSTRSDKADSSTREHTKEHKRHSSKSHGKCWVFLLYFMY